MSNVSIINNNVVFARKYRPMKLLDLRSQDILVRAVSNALLHNKFVHSYLFTGIRGIGKTTSARIIARTLNCTKLEFVSNVANPCEVHSEGICENCRAAANAKHPDIVEMDAASRTGVDDVRTIIESAEYKPMLGKYKVFIIDEVHMLSKNAFNAILKLLEEPQEHTIFIFATTEVQKIPLTVISRCQRFDLHRFSLDDLVSLFEYVAKCESFSIERDASYDIARYADGSARDGLSMLNQAVALSYDTSDSKDLLVSKHIVQKMLGTNGFKSGMDYLNAIASNNPNEALRIINQIYSVSSDFTYLYKDVLETVLVLTKILANIDISDHRIESENIEALHNLAKKVSVPWLHVVWKLIFQHTQNVKFATNELHSVQMLTLQLIYSSTIPTLEQLCDTLIQNNATSSSENKSVSTTHSPRQS